MGICRQGQGGHRSGHCYTSTATKIKNDAVSSLTGTEDLYYWISFEQKQNKIHGKCNDQVCTTDVTFLGLTKPNDQICHAKANQPVVDLVKWAVVSAPHQGSNPVARIIPGFISGFPAMRFQWEETFPSTTRRLR